MGIWVVEEPFKSFSVGKRSCRILTVRFIRIRKEKNPEHKIPLFDKQQKQPPMMRKLFFYYSAADISNIKPGCSTRDRSGLPNNPTLRVLW